MNARIMNYELLTTPGLHFLTLFNQYLFNTDYLRFAFVEKEIYWKFLVNGYKSFNLCYDKFLKKLPSYKYENEITIDCANGLASCFTNIIKEIFGDDVKINFINTDIQSYEKLNDMCGADYIHKERKNPSEIINTRKGVSFDGDVDRIVY